MAKEKYKNNVAWLFKKLDNVKGESKTPSYETDGTPFYCNKQTISRRIQQSGANQYIYVSTEVIKTTKQLNFARFDRIAFTSSPSNDVNSQDFSIIDNIEPRVIQDKGSKFRAKEYYEYWITLT